MINEEGTLLVVNGERITNNSTSVNDILTAIVFAEKAMSLEEHWPWEDNELRSRRGAYKFDENVQEIMLAFRIDGFNSEIISCGNNGYYRCKLFIDAGGTILFGISLDKSVAYLRPYIELNNDMRAPGFLFFQYSLNESKNMVEKLIVVIPNPLGRNTRIDITSKLSEIRNNLFDKYNSKDQLINAVLTNRLNPAEPVGINE